MDSPTDRPHPLSSSERADLALALDDEYMAHAIYTQVIADFGEMRPFSNIVEAEARHIEALTTLFQRYEVPIPADTWPGRVPRYESLQEACQAGVIAEVENGELYDRLLAGTNRSDILTVYRNLQEASQERHLEAFRRCADRGDGPDRGPRGLGHRRRWRGGRG
ncbi:MAG: DUF2202 domain-containing protein [Ilumatobacteraceae bacterium]|nr:DUF2202 domain-containing protein [Ilumatobacteraceae bacterium]